MRGGGACVEVLPHLLGQGAWNRASKALLVGNTVFALGSGELTQGLYMLSGCSLSMSYILELEDQGLASQCWVEWEGPAHLEKWVGDPVFIYLWGK